MRKLRIKRIVLLILAVLIAVYIAWDFSQVSAFEGKYKSVEESYALTFSKTGRVEITDSENIVVFKGLVYSVTDSGNPYRIHTYGKTNFVLRPHNKRPSVWLTVIGRGEEMEPCRVVSLETDVDSMQFDEIP